MSTPPPPSTPPQPPRPASGDDGRTLRTVLIVVAVVVLLGGGLLAAIVFGVFQLFGGVEGFTSHIDRANQYLDAARTDPVVAEQMLCSPEAVAPTTEQALAASTGQNLTTFDVNNGSGSVDGRVTLGAGEDVAIRVLTSGPALPTEAGASEVCIADVRLGR